MINYISNNTFLEIENSFMISVDNNSDYFYLEHHYYGCRALWRAIIMQAVIDSISEYKRTEYRIAKMNAINWLQSDSQNFRLVCYLAGYNANFVRKKSMELLMANQNGDRRLKSLYNFEKNI